MNTQPGAPTDIEQLKGKIHALQEAVQTQLPTYSTILKDIHRSLQQDGTAVVLLTEEEIGVICVALSKQTGVVIAKEVVSKNKLSNGKRLKDVGSDDLI